MSPADWQSRSWAARVAIVAHCPSERASRSNALVSARLKPWRRHSERESALCLAHKPASQPATKSARHETSADNWAQRALSHSEVVPSSSLTCSKECCQILSPRPTPAWRLVSGANIKLSSSNGTTGKPVPAEKLICIVPVAVTTMCAGQQTSHSTPPPLIWLLCQCLFSAPESWRARH